FTTAGAAIGASLQCRSNRLDTVAPGTHGRDDLVDADAKAGADGGSWVRPVRRRPAGDEREAPAQVCVLRPKLRDRPVSRHRHRLPREEEGGKEMRAVEEGEPDFAALPVG